jgi:hypothetical protein
LQFNVNNAINGDMVSGTAGGTADVNGNTITATSGSFAALSPPHPIVVNGASFVITAVVDPTHATLNGAPGNATGVPWSTPSPGFPDASCAAVASGPHAEDCQYNRSDFSPNTDLTKSSLAPSFLVRLRRTDHRNDALDRNSNVAPALGVSSSGEPLPFLFARGTFINGADPNNAAVYSPRRDGLTVRATALAGARPALHVGSPATLPGSPPVTGVMPFAFTECFWSTTLSNGTPVSFSVNSSGIITIPTACIDGAGMFYVQPAQTVGNVITSLGMQGSPPVVPGYVPIYDPSLGNLVIGFGFLNTPSGGTPQISKVSSSMAVTNATALVTGGFPVSGATLAAVLLANGRLNGEGALLVPVIAR